MESKTLNEIAKLMDRILCRTELDDPIHRIALEAQNICDAKLMDEPKDATTPIGKLREALVSVQKIINCLIGRYNVPNSLVANRMEINAIINNALAAPRLNCEVGTAEEQSERMNKFCLKYWKNGCNKMCPLNHDRGEGIVCALAWAQMPYEESSFAKATEDKGGAK